MSAEHLKKDKGIEGGKPSYSVVALVILLCLLPFVGSLTPRFFAFGPGIAGLVSLILWWAFYRRLPHMVLSGFVVGGAAVGLGLLSSLWAIDSEFAVERSFKVLGVMMPLAVLCSMAMNVDYAGRVLFVKFFPIFVIVAGVVCAINLYGDGAIYYLSRERIRQNFNLSLINRNVVIFMFCALVSIYALKVSDWGASAKRAMTGLLAILVALALYRTHSQTVQLSAILAVIVWFLFPIARRWVWVVLAIIMLAGVVGAPWIAQIMYNHIAAGVAIDGTVMAQAYMADRMEIWDFVGRHALQNPLYGFGIEATRMVEEFDTPMLYNRSAHVLHPHNFALQAWIEFGVIGVVAVSAFIGFIMMKIWRLKRLAERRLALVLFAVMMVLQSTSYGVWQGWFLGLCGFVIACFMMVRGFEEVEE